MIGYIKGKITALFDRMCFIETAGVGYRVFITDIDHDELQTGEESRLYIHMAVREDAITLYGFLSRETYEAFLSLLTVSKIGPKAAMSILSVMTPGTLAIAVQNRNISALTKIPGIGKKTAERMLVELKDKLKGFVPAGEVTTDVAEPAIASGIEEEVMNALRSLGYMPEEVAAVIHRVALEHPEFTDAGPMIGAVLRELGKERG